MSTIRFKSILSAVMMVTLLSSCQPQDGSSQIEFRAPVTVTDVKLDTIEDLIITTGTVRAPELIKLTVMTGGLLQIAKGENGRLAEGDFVNAGDLIASVTGEDVRLAARMKVAKQRLIEAKKKLNATEALYKKNLVSASIYEGDKTLLENAKLEYETSLHSENRNRIVSPIDGIILKLARDDGQLMADGQLLVPGQIVAQVASLRSVIADVDLVGKDIVRVKPGLKARAKYYAWQERDFSGTVLRLSPTLDENSRSLRAQIEIDNEDMRLKPGMFVEVSLVVERRENITVVPRRALAMRGGRRIVFVVNGQRAEQRIVELGLGDDKNVEIIKGVQAGERLVVLGLETLTDQMPVRVTSQ